MKVFAARTPTRPRAQQKSLQIAETVIAFSRRGHPKRAPWFGGDLTVDVVDEERIARLTTRYRVSRPAKHAAGRRFSVPCWRASRRQALPRTEASSSGRAARSAVQGRGVDRLAAATELGARRPTRLTPRSLTGQFQRARGELVTNGEPVSAIPKR